MATRALDVEHKGMIFWVATAAKAARQDAGLRQVHVAAAIDRDQATIFRFERGDAWPRDPDLILHGYELALELDPFDIWQAAVDLWRDALETS